VDDLVLLAPTKARIRKAIKVTYQTLKPWGYQLHTNEKNFYSQNSQGL
jgi:hypothetical protein